MVSSNLTQWILGGTRGPELRETREAWEQVEGAWRTSPLYGLDTAKYAVELVWACASRHSPRPAEQITLALAEAVEEVLWREEIGEVEVDWALVAEDVGEAVRFREMMGRRRRWATDFDRMSAAFRRQMSVACDAVLEGLPPSCFRDWEVDGARSAVA